MEDQKQKLGFDYSEYMKNSEYAQHSHNSRKAHHPPLAQSSVKSTTTLQTNQNVVNANTASAGLSFNNFYKDPQQVISNVASRMSYQNSKQSSNFGSTNKKQKIDFTEIMQQLSQPSNHGTPNKENQRHIQSYLYDETQSTRPLNQLRAEEMRSDHTGFDQLEEIDENSSSMAISQLNDIVEQRKKKQRAEADKENLISNAKLPKKPKVNINLMVNQLGDLKDHIKQLEQKIDFTVQRSPSEKRSHSKVKSFDNRFTPSMLQDFNHHQKSMKKSLKSSSKNVSWRNSQIIQDSLSIDEYGKRLSGGTRAINKGGSVIKFSNTNVSEQSLERQSHFRPKASAYLDNSASTKKQAKASLNPAKSCSNQQFSIISHSRTTSNAISSYRQSHDGKHKPASTAYLRGTDAKIESQSSLSNTQTKRFITTENLNDLLQDSNPMRNLPENQHQLLNLKLKECDQLKQTCLKLKKKVKTLKTEVSDKDQIIGNYKNLSKELRVMKDQWRMSEDIRNQQVSQIKKLQDQLQLAGKEQTKLKKKVAKLKEKTVNPFKVFIEEKEGFSTSKKTKKQVVRD